MTIFFLIGGYILSGIISAAAFSEISWLRKIPPFVIAALWPLSLAAVLIYGVAMVVLFILVVIFGFLKNLGK